MNDDQGDPIEDLLRRAAKDPSPTERERAHAAAVLDQAISNERFRASRTRGRFLRLGLVMSSIAAMIVVGFLLSSDPAAAAFGELAMAAEQTDPLLIPAQSFAYTRAETRVLVVLPEEAFGDVAVSSDEVAYILPQIRESWLSSDGVQQLHTQTAAPIFFDPISEAAYYQAGIHQLDRVGEAVRETFTGVTTALDQEWPTTPANLLEAIRSRFPPDRGLPEYVEILDISLDLLRESTATPQLRSAVLEVLADLDFELVEDHANGSATFAVDYEGPLPTKATFTLDSTGQLLAETTTLTHGDPALNIQPGTTTFQARYSAVKIVDEIGASPRADGRRSTH